MRNDPALLHVGRALSDGVGAPVLVGVDVGGTFTDLVVFDGKRLELHKTPTTPDDQSRAIVTGLADLGITHADLVHGMTIATNALLERRGARTGLLTTAGFRDVLVIGRQNRPQIYALHQERPTALVTDDHRYEAVERLDFQGRIVTPLDEAGVKALAESLVADDLESMAIVFLFAFRNAGHEQRAAELIRAVAPDLPLSLSSDILPEYREYERTSTTVINAYVQPLVARYLQRLEASLPECNIRIMQSNGGIIGLRQAADQAARVVLSGPAGGVVGAFTLASTASNNPAPRIMTFDMGGTSTDVSLCPGEIPATSESVITDLPLRLPVIDIHTVGAGGGSIAYIDAGGGLRVGPRSAGARPGPVCYGRGGAEPTVTDANLVLGRLDADGFLGGRGSVVLDRDAAHAAVGLLGRAFQLTPEAAALGIIRVANATMERALRRVSVERGHDPRRFTLVPFGGAGPLHACDLAESLGVRSILLPPMPGVLSAYGMLVADIVNDAAQTVLIGAESLQNDPSPLVEICELLTARVLAVLRTEGINDPALEALLDLRYRGQSYELTAPIRLPLTPASVVDAVASFHEIHARRYGYALEQEPVEAVTLRVRGIGSGARPELPWAPLESADATPARMVEKPVWFDSHAPSLTPFYARERLRPGNRFDGPAVILQFDTTTVVTPGWNARVDEFRNLWLEKGETR